MPSAKLALVIGLSAVSLSACGIAAKPEAGTPQAVATNRKAVDDPRQVHVACLDADHIPVTEFGGTWLQIESKPSGPTVHFLPTPGAAQEQQISGHVESAEVIGSALLYPNQASAGLLQRVETCVAQGVKG
jgi:hypothetical protein